MYNTPGVIKVSVFFGGESNNTHIYGTFEDSPYSNALFGLVF